MSPLDLLSEFRISRISLPTRGTGPLTLECVARVTSAPYFEAVFLPGELPVGELATEETCRLHFDAAGEPHVVKARIESFTDEDRLRLFALETGVPRQKREYFRVDSRLYLDFRPLQPEPRQRVESFEGVVNLSGGGIFFPVPESVKPGTELLLNLVLGDPFGEARGLVGEVVRVHETRRGQRWVGVKFTRIAPQDRDRIIAFCLAEQRKTLRLRVLTIPPG